MISNQEKQRVWDAYRSGKPIRVPSIWTVNPRNVVLDPKFNPKGVTFEEYFLNADVTVDMQLKFMDYQANYLWQYSDYATGRPEAFQFYQDNQNIYDAAYFGSPIHFRQGQVPDCTTILAGDDKNRIFDFDIDHPLDNPFVKQCIARHEALQAAAAKVSVPGVKLSVRPLSMGWDGPLTIATQLRGEDIFIDLLDDPDYAIRLMTFIQKAAEIRNRALAEYAGVKSPFDAPAGFLADDSIQLINTDMYKELILPLHRQWYGLYAGKGPHFIHLCGDATRHFPTIHEELNVGIFDTGFPVNHGALRKALGEDVEIQGGPEIALVLGGTREQVYARTKEILKSGVTVGGKFILHEANNLPPCCPEENLAAMYQCCLDHGNY